MTTTLRPSQPADEPFLFRVYSSSRVEELAPLGWDEKQQHQFLSMQFRAQDMDYRKRCPEAQFDVILHNGEQVGRFYVDRRENEIRILDICLLPEHRNQGIGTPLIEELLSEAQKSHKKLSIYVESYNPSLRLFGRLGFEAIEEEKGNPLLLLEWSPPVKTSGQLL